MSEITIAIDAMGGENAPIAILQAVKNTCIQRQDLKFLIYGNQNIILPMITKLNIESRAIEVIHTTEIILDNDKATEPLRNKKKSSMRGAIDAVMNKSAHACVSAGNTGALMLTARMILGSIENVKRPAIVGVIPTVSTSSCGRCVLLDMGANITCDEIILSQFATMGICFAKVVLNKDNPTIGILNVGIEKSKGRELEQKTYQILSSTFDNFIGYIEGHEVIHGKVDVVVTDGFSGNIFLKASEGVAQVYTKQLKRAISTNFITKMCGFILKSYLKKQLTFLDPNINNGAMLVGINGIVVKSHGSSNVIAFESAINVAISLVEHNVNDKIICEIASLKDNDNQVFEIFDKIKSTSAKILNWHKK